MNSVVYGLHLSDGDFKYFGVTSREISVRIREHVSDARNNSQLPVHRWIRKHPDFKYSIIFECATFDEALKIEKELISRHGVKNLLNCTGGGEGIIGFKHSVESKIKQSESAIIRAQKPGESERRSNAAKEFYSTEAGRLAIKASIKKRMSNKDFTDRQAERNREISARPDVREKIRESALSRKLIECFKCGKLATKQNITRWHNEKCGLGISAETSQKLKDANAKIWTLEMRENARQKTLNQQKNKCPYCEVLASPGMYARHHGGKCKFNTDKLN